MVSNCTTFLRCATSHRCTLSADTARNLPLCEKNTDCAQPPCSPKSAIVFPDAASSKRTFDLIGDLLLSASGPSATASRLLSGEKQTCPWNNPKPSPFATHFPVAMSQIHPDTASSRPSGDRAASPNRKPNRSW